MVNTPTDMLKLERPLKFMNCNKTKYARKKKEKEKKCTRQSNLKKKKKKKKSTVQDNPTEGAKNKQTKILCKIIQ